MIIKREINFSNIHDRVNAAENMQRAGLNSDAERILTDLAYDLLGTKPEKPPHKK